MSYSTRISFLSKEEKEDFLKEEKRSSKYREYLERILLNEIRIAAEKEESMTDHSEILKSVTTRLAMRKLINTLRNRK